MIVKEILLTEVLRLINLARSNMGLNILDKIPLGLQRSDKFCPIANGINGINPFATFPMQRVTKIDADRISIRNISCGFDYNSSHTNEILIDQLRELWGVEKYGPCRVYKPVAFAQFTKSFDSGELPEYNYYEIYKQQITDMISKV